MWGLVYLRPGLVHNEQRKMFNQVLGPRAVTAFDAMLQEGAGEFAKALLGFSGDPEHVIHQYAPLLRTTYIPSHCKQFSRRSYSQDYLW